MKGEHRGLVGDVGGTNARFALLDPEGRIKAPKVYACADYGSLDDIIAEYLETTAGRLCPQRAVIAVAGPVIDGGITFTNLDWSVSEIELLGAFPFESIALINDFAAQAMGAPALEAEDLRRLGPDLRGASECPLAVMGAGHRLRPGRPGALGPDRRLPGHRGRPFGLRAL